MKKTFSFRNLFLVLLWAYFEQCLSVFNIEFGQVNTGCNIQGKWTIYVFFIFNLLVLLFRLPVFRVVFFSIFQFIGDTTLLRVTVLKQTYKRKKHFKMAKSITRGNIFNGK